MENSFFAIDFGSSVKVAIVKVEDNNLDLVELDEIENTNFDDTKLLKQLSSSIEALKKDVGIDYIVDKAYVSLSSIYINSIKSKGSIKLPNNKVTTADINQVLQNALLNANIPLDSSLVHLIGMGYKLDENTMSSPPIGKIGEKLEVIVNVLYTRRDILNKIKTILKQSMVTNIVFASASYMSALAVINEEFKNSGAYILDLGASYTDVAVFKQNVLLYSFGLEIGSNNIDQDISIIKGVTKESAKIAKIEYGTLRKLTQDKKIVLQNDNRDDVQISLNELQHIIHARVEELFVLINKELEENNMSNKANVVLLTGGLSLMPGIDRLASKVFNKPCYIGQIRDINGMVFDENGLSTLAGLIRYGLNLDDIYQLNSNKELTKKDNISTDVLDLRDLDDLQSNSDDGFIKKLGKMFGGIF